MRNKRNITSSETKKVWFSLLVPISFIFLLAFPYILSAQTRGDSLPTYTSFELKPIFNKARTVKTNGVVTEYSTPVTLGGLAGFKLGYKINNHWGTWSFSLYNLYNRKNPYSYFFDVKFGQSDNGNTSQSERVLYKRTLFPLIPSLSYTWKF